MIRLEHILATVYNTIQILCCLLGSIVQLTKLVANNYKILNSWSVTVLTELTAGSAVNSPHRHAT